MPDSLLTGNGIILWKISVCRRVWGSHRTLEQRKKFPLETPVKGLKIWLQYIARVLRNYTFSVVEKRMCHVGISRARYQIVLSEKRTKSGQLSWSWA